MLNSCGRLGSFLEAFNSGNRHKPFPEPVNSEDRWFASFLEVLNSRGRLRSFL